MMAGAAGGLLGSLFFASFNMGFMTGIKAFVAATLVVLKRRGRNDRRADFRITIRFPKC